MLVRLSACCPPALTSRVLTDEGDEESLDFYCSCESFRRPALVRSAGKEEIQTFPSYSIASVFTPPQFRQKGYGRKMMALLSSFLALPCTPLSPGKGAEQEEKSVVAPEWQGGKDGALSFLFSDVGDFYGQKGLGWSIKDRSITTWIPSDFATSTLPALTPSSISTLDQFAKIAELDTLLLRAALASAPAVTASFVIQPTPTIYSWLRARELFHYDHLASPSCTTPPASWGAQIGTEGQEDHSFILWHLDFPKTTLKILRYHCSPLSSCKDHARILLEHVNGIARTYGCDKVIAWNLPESIRLRLKEKGMQGVTTDREDSLGAAWFYGAPGDAREGAGAARWIANEAYGWC